MNAAFSYIIKAVLASGVLYLYYLAALRNKKFHSYNRFYLLLSLIISLTVPFINFKWWYIDESQPAAVTGLANLINNGEKSDTAGYFTTGTALFFVCAGISIMLLTVLTAKIVSIYSIKSRSRKTCMKDFTFIETEAKQAPFSFLSNLFWKQGLSITDASGERIFKHELTHIRQKHSVDRLITQTACCLLWMNPFFWLMQKELNTIHEFIADAASVDDGDTESFAKMLLYAYNRGHYLSPSHAFFNSSIKRRLTMISSSTQPRYSYMRRLLALPVILFVLALLSLSVKGQKKATAPAAAPQAAQQPATDTLPKTVAAQPVPVSAAGQPVQTTAQQEPRTVIGYKLDNLAGQEPAKAASLSPIVVTGYKLDNITTEPVPVAGQQPAKAASQEPIKVAGFKIDVPQGAEPATVQQPAKAASLQPKAVAGYKPDNIDPEQAPAAATQPDKAASVEPIKVAGFKIDVPANPEPAAAGKQAGKKGKTSAKSATTN